MAYSGLSRISKSRGEYKEAIKYLNQAQSISDDFSFQQELTELYRITNQQDLAAASARRTIFLLGGYSGNESEANHGHYADKELAYAYLDSYDYLNAYKHALIEYNRRPDNIEVNQAMAWVSYKLGRYEDANMYSDVALKTNSKNPVLNYQAGLIKIKAGKNSTGKKLIEQSLALNPHLTPLLKWEMKKTIALK